MSILVTGGTGLVGSRLLRRLVESGVDCRALVREGKAIPSGVTPTEGDILDPASLAGAVKDVSAILHFAAVLRTPEPETIWKTNLEGTRNLIAAIKRHSPQARFIMASTGLVYDARGPRPAREDDAVDPKMPYPASRVGAENALRSSGLSWSVLRLGFFYGDKDGHLGSVPKLAEMFKWHPANRLSMIHNRDIEIVVKQALTGAIHGRIVNIVDEAPMSIFEITAYVGATVESSSEPLAHPWWGQLDGSLARRLGSRPLLATLHQAAREGAL